ncbi:MAG: hypothetical protein ABI597_09305 [Gammaproteobacteria bacterium]
MKSHVKYVELQELKEDQLEVPDAVELQALKEDQLEVSDAEVKAVSIYFRLPTVMWLNIYSYLDVKSAVRFHIMYPKHEALTTYVANNQDVLHKMVDTYFVENTLPVFKANIDTAVTDELTRRNAVVTDRPVKKSTWARVLTGAGAALASLLPAWNIKKSLYAFSQSKILSDLKTAVFDQLLAYVDPNKLTQDNFYSERECDLTPDGQYVSHVCRCTYDSLVNSCRYDVTPCADNGGISAYFQQCNATLWSTFTSACDDLDGRFGYAYSKYAWAAAAIVIGGTILCITGSICVVASDLDNLKGKSEIEQDKFSALPLPIKIQRDPCSRYFLERHFFSEGKENPTIKEILSKFSELQEGSNLQSHKTVFGSKKLSEIPCTLFFRKQPNPSLSSSSSHIIQIEHKRSS